MSTSTDAGRTALSVQRGLEDAISVVGKLIKEKKWKYFEWSSEYHARRVLEALEKALARYKKEAQRVGKYRVS